MAGEQAEEEAEAIPLLSGSPDAFWAAPDGVPELALAFALPAVDALPVKRLGTPAFWQSRRNFADLMEQAYQAISAQALRLAVGDE